MKFSRVSRDKKMQFQGPTKKLCFSRYLRDFSRAEKNSRVFPGFQGFQGSLATMPSLFDCDKIYASATKNKTFKDLFLGIFILVTLEMEESAKVQSCVLYNFNVKGKKSFGKD